MTRNEFLELLARAKTERLLSSEAEKLFGAAKGKQYSLTLDFISYSSAFGRQIHSEYDNGYKFECATADDLQVVVLFQEKCKEFVDQLRGQTSREIHLEVLGYDSLYQKPILGYLVKEFTDQVLTPGPAPAPIPEPIPEPIPGPDMDTLANSEPHHWTKGSNQIGKHWASGNLQPILDEIQEAHHPPADSKSWGGIRTFVLGALFVMFLIAGPIFFSDFEAKSETARPVTATLTDTRRQHITSRAFDFDFRAAEKSFESGQYAIARWQTLSALDHINFRNSGLSGQENKRLNYRAHNLLGRIYDRVGENYESYRSFHQAKKFYYRQGRIKADPKSPEARSLEEFIDKQLLKLKDQGMGSLIDESKRTLNPVNKKWLDSVIRTAADDSQLTAGPKPLTLVLVQTKEPYSGWVKTVHEAGSIKELIHYAQGQRHGHYRSWKIDGTVASIATYDKGRKTGLNPTFGETGHADSKSIRMYKNGRLLETKPPARN